MGRVTPVPAQPFFHFRRITLNPAVNRGVIDIHSAFSQHLLQLTVTDAVFAVPAYGPQNDVTLKMPAFEWVHVQLHQQKGMISLSPPTICNSAAYVTGFVRSGNTYTANGAAEMIKEIVANIKSDDLEILFRMDSGYFDEKIIETIESLGCKYLIKAKSYSTLTSQATNSSIVFVKGEEGRETTELYTKLVKWEKDRRFVVSRVLKPEKERAQLSLLEGSEYDYFFFVTNTTLLSEKVVIYYEKRGNAENYIKEAKYDMAVGHLLLKSFWANEAVFQMMMLSYNLFLLFKFDSLDSSEYRQQIKTFRLKYVFLAAKIIKTARYVIMKLSENYPYKGVYEKCLV
ncbi:IS1380 family transposase (plasmid) [Klebsiella pneumoniae]|nr:IS1380 family transposase [Klebsiella pneumoniae]